MVEGFNAELQRILIVAQVEMDRVPDRNSPDRRLGRVLADTLVANVLPEGDGYVPIGLVG